MTKVNMKTVNMKMLTVCAGVALCAGLGEARPFRPPAVPLVQNDPFFSVWSAADRLTDCETTHWSQKSQPISITLTADGRAYRLCGASPKDVPALRQVSTEVRPTQTVCRFAEGELRAELRFSTYKLTEDLDRFTRPVTYVTLRVKGANAWSADLGLSHLLATEDESAAMTTNRCEVAGLRAVSIGRTVQRPLGESGDRVRCNWGYAWAVGPKVADGEAHWLLAYDDVSCLRFLGKERPAWWRRNGQPFAAMLEAAERDYGTTIAELDRFDADFAADLRRTGGEKFATLAALAWRQSFAACNVVAGDSGEPLMFSKENASNGCMGTVDLIYPQLPHLLLTGATLVKASLEPIMLYSQTDDWPYDYAPHDVGQYPLGDGQRYGMKRRDGKDHPDADRMPVEESGNMLIAFAALTKLEGHADYAGRWWPTLLKWAEYLERVGFDPQEQLCTDDFAGHLAHNANLSAKTIVALGAFGQMAKVRGEKETAEKYETLARRLAGEWTKLAGKAREKATPIVIRFDYGGKSHGMPLRDTWSQKYNLVWDRVLGLGLFPDRIGRDECAAYRRLLQPYGLPLDSRLAYTKSDWTIWSATLSGRRDDFEAIVAALYRAYDETPDRMPMTDWYWADNAKWRGFIARSVVGAYFLPLLYDRGLWAKWSKGAGLRERPTPPRDRVDVMVDVGHPTHEISKNLYGLFLEDISQSVDGCLYPELVWNRGFDFPPSPTVADPDYVKNRVELDTICGWKSDCREGSAGRFTVQYDDPVFAKTPAYLRIEAFAPCAGMRNLGAMDEMSVSSGVPLSLNLYARGIPFEVRLETEDGDLLAMASFAPRADWRPYAARLVPSGSEKRAHLSILTKTAGTLDLEQVSLMPERLFKGRTNGVREDIGELMAALKPSTFRFPGGCMLEGVKFDSWYDWKRSVGPVAERTPIWNCWGYYQTLGLGYYEYLQFCEDMGASPVPVFAAAMTCQNRRPEFAPMSAIGYFVTNILDGIEFACGGTDTKWGRLRAEMGHPAPFRLDYVGIGNENRNAEYWERHNAMAAAVRAAHPDLKIVASVDHRAYYMREARAYSWSHISKANADVADEHLYASPSWLLNNTRMYDSYERKGVDVYVGEWATRNASYRYVNSMYNAVAEAAFRMGFERNADLVKMSAYAPLVRRVGVPGNRYSLIQLDGVGSCGAPAYWCDRMFAESRPDRLVPCSYPEVKWIQPSGVDLETWPQTRGSPAVEVVSFHAVAGIRGRELILRLANAAWADQPVRLSFDRTMPAGTVARTILAGRPDAGNSPSAPLQVHPSVDTFGFDGGKVLDVTMPSCSVMVLRVERGGCILP